MKIGKGLSGIIVVTTNEQSVKIWANVHHLCGELLTELESLRTQHKSNKHIHKQESTRRINADAEV